MACCCLRRRRQRQSQFITVSKQASQNGTEPHIPGSGHDVPGWGVTPGQQAHEDPARPSAPAWAAPPIDQDLGNSYLPSTAVQKSQQSRRPARRARLGVFEIVIIFFTMATVGVAAWGLAQSIISSEVQFSKLLLVKVPPSPAVFESSAWSSSPLSFYTDVRCVPGLGGRLLGPGCARAGARHQRGAGPG